MNATIASPPRVSLLRCHALEARHEFLRLLRAPSFAVPTLVFPAMFYLLFAVAFAKPGGAFQGNVYLMATYSVFGVMAPGLFGFGVTVALDRDRGWLRLKRALPMPPGAYLAAKLMMAMLFAAIIVAILALLGATLGHVRLPASAWLLLFVVDVLGVLPFAAIGLFVGTHVGGQGAPAVLNLVYLPMSFLSGLWIPIASLPGAVRAVAPLWPAFHLGQLALHAVGQPSDGALGVHIGALSLITAAFVLAARRRLARSG